MSEDVWLLAESPEPRDEIIIRTSVPNNIMYVKTGDKIKNFFNQYFNLDAVVVAQWFIPSLRCQLQTGVTRIRLQMCRRSFTLRCFLVLLFVLGIECRSSSRKCFVYYWPIALRTMCVTPPYFETMIHAFDSTIKKWCESYVAKGFFSF